MLADTIGPAGHPQNPRFSNETPIHAPMQTAEKGDTVQVHYTGTLSDGTVFDSSRDREPLRFKLGGGQLIPDFEDAVEGMTPGQSKTFTVEAADAYGLHRDDLVFDVQRSQFPDDIPLVKGTHIEIVDKEGESTTAVIDNVTDDAVTLDANHPLAGADLTFDVSLVEIE